MSHDPQSPTDAADFAEDDLPDALCEDCGEPIDANDISVEAFETTGRLICAECFAELFADDSEEDCCPGCGACPGFIGAECDETCGWAKENG